MKHTTIELANDLASERATRDLLLSLFAEYGLERYLYAETLRIEEGVTPHSHPILTLSTAPVKPDPPDATLLLSAYLHEQVHWFLTLEANHQTFLNVVAQFRKRHPDLPVGSPEGCRSEFSNYLHIVVNWLEYDSLRTLLGAEKAYTELKGRNFYTHIYALVLENDTDIRETLHRHDLLLPERPPEPKAFRQVNLS